MCVCHAFMFCRFNFAKNVLYIAVNVEAVAFQGFNTVWRVFIASGISHEIYK